jgi:anti-sigma factor RsiW
MHPELEWLVRYSDGEGTPDERQSLERHLARCAACRLELERLHMAEAEGHLQPAPPLAPLLADIQEWSERRRKQDPDSQAVISRVVRMLQPYLGNEGSRRLVGGVSREGVDLLGTVEPVLACFLGRRATQKLVGHIVECAIMRT